VGREEQLQWERKNAWWAAAAAFLAAIIPIATPIYARQLLGDLPEKREDIFFQRVHEHASGYVLVGVVIGIGVVLLAPLLVYLYRAIKPRRDLIPRIALTLAIIAPIVSGGVGVANQAVLVHAADQFVSQPARPLTDAQKLKLQKITDADAYEKAVQKLGPTGRAKEKLQSGSVVVVAYAGLIANLLLGTALVLIALHAMRAGLMSRFMGILGVIVGAVTAIPILGRSAPIVEVFWLVAVGMLVLNRWPQGRGPAWAAVEAIPWPTAADKRDALNPVGSAAGRSRPARGRKPDDQGDVVDDAPDHSEPLHTREAARPRASAEHPRSKKRKRKRRG